MTVNLDEISIQKAVQSKLNEKGHTFWESTGISIDVSIPGMNKNHIFVRQTLQIIMDHFMNICTKEKWLVIEERICYFPKFYRLVFVVSGDNELIKKRCMDLGNDGEFKWFTNVNIFSVQNNLAEVDGFAFSSKQKNNARLRKKQVERVKNMLQKKQSIGQKLYGVLLVWH